MWFLSFFQAQKSGNASSSSMSPERGQTRRCAPPARGSAATLRWTEEQDQSVDDLRTSINEARTEQGYNQTSLLPFTSAQPSSPISRQVHTATSAEILRYGGRSTSDEQRPREEDLSATAPDSFLDLLPPQPAFNLSLSGPVTNYSVEPCSTHGILFLNPESYLFKECSASTLKSFSDIFDGETSQSPAEHIADALKDVLEGLSSADNAAAGPPTPSDKRKGKQKLYYEDEELEAEYASRDGARCGLGMSLEGEEEDSLQVQESSVTPPPAPRLASQPFPASPPVPAIMISPAPESVSSSDEQTMGLDPTRLMPSARRPISWALEIEEVDNTEPLAEISYHMQSLSVFEYDSDSSEDGWSSDEGDNFEEFEEDEEWLAHPCSSRRTVPKAVSQSASGRPLEPIPEETEGAFVEEVYEEILEKVLAEAPERDPDEDPEAEEAAMRVFEAIAQGNLHKLLEKLHDEARQAQTEEDSEAEEDPGAEKALENRVFEQIVQANLDLVLEELCETVPKQDYEEYSEKDSEKDSEDDFEEDPEAEPEPKESPESAQDSESGQPEQSPENDSEPSPDSTVPGSVSDEAPAVPATVPDSYFGFQPCKTYDSDEEEVTPFSPRGKEILRDVRQYFNMPEITRPNKIQAYFNRNPELLRCLSMRTIPHPRWQFWHHSRLYEMKICRKTKKAALRKLDLMVTSLNKLSWTDKKVKSTTEQIHKARGKGTYAGGKSATIDKMLLKTLRGRENPFLVRRQIVLGAPAGRDVMTRWNEQVRRRKNRMRSLLINEVLFEE